MTQATSPSGAPATSWRGQERTAPGCRRLAGAAFLGLPDAALIPLLPVVVIFVAVVVNRGRMPTAGQLTDLIIPR